MIESFAKNLVNVKKEFTKIYSGSSQIQEVIPSTNSRLIPIEENYIKLLHLFAKKNPIYYNFYEQQILDIPFMVYEGDINKFWLNSIQHESSYAPFSPTWILSAFFLAQCAKDMGFEEIIDIGSGDGRIAYCAKSIGLEAYSLELDGSLVDLQNSISNQTNIKFNPKCSDATIFDYHSLNLENPIFFIGGLAQMGGIKLATGVLENITSNIGLQKMGMAFAGTLSEKYAQDPKGQAGWGELISKYDLKITNTLSLPTMWTLKEKDDTPYIFSEFQF